MSMVRTISGLVLFASTLLGVVTVYQVDPYANLNDSAYIIRQSWVATCDSVVSVYFFAGRSPKTSNYNYRLAIRDNGQELGYIEVDDDPEYQFVGGEFSQPIPLVKGKKYELEIRHTGDKRVNFYYHPDVYAPGSLKTPNMPDYDLVARVWGRNDTSGGYFGFSGLFGSSGLFGLSSSSGLI